MVLYQEEELCQVEVVSSEEHLTGVCYQAVGQVTSGQVVVELADIYLAGVLLVLDQGPLVCCHQDTLGTLALLPVCCPLQQTDNSHHHLPPW